MGDNGATKTPLVKLLAGLYRPDAGTIAVDETDLSQPDSDRWRQEVSGGFQDHACWEFTVAEAVGLGHLTRLADPTAPQPRRGVRPTFERRVFGLRVQRGGALVQ